MSTKGDLLRARLAAMRSEACLVAPTLAQGVLPDLDTWELSDVVVYLSMAVNFYEPSQMLRQLLEQKNATVSAAEFDRLLEILKRFIEWFRAL